MTTEALSSATPKAEQGETPPTQHVRRGSVPLSPFWASDPEDRATRDDDEALGSPRVHSKGIIEVPMTEIAFFPLPLDDCASDQRAMPPEERISRRVSAAREAPARVPSVVQADEGDGLVDIQGVPKTMKEDISNTSISSDTTVASSSDSIRSEFSENTAGSKCSTRLPWSSLDYGTFSNLYPPFSL